jgi:hypothetical protein
MYIVPLMWLRTIMEYQYKTPGSGGMTYKYLLLGGWLITPFSKPGIPLNMYGELW